MSNESEFDIALRVAGRAKTKDKAIQETLNTAKEEIDRIKNYRKIGWLSGMDALEMIAHTAGEFQTTQAEILNFDYTTERE